MNGATIATLVSKDLQLFFKNRFFAVVTILAIVAYTAIYYLLPQELDETLEFGIVRGGLPAAATEEVEGEGIEFVEFGDQTALISAVSEGEPPVGVVFPQDLTEALVAGGRPEIKVYTWADLEPEFQELFPIIIEEWMSALAGVELGVELNAEVLGEERAIATRDRMLPLLAVFVLLVESLGLATLISTEVASGTIRALLVTPLTVLGLFVGKAVTGILLAWTESSAVMALTGGLLSDPLLVLLILLIGSAMVTGVAFLLASGSKDLMDVMSKGILAILTLAIPALAVLLPGLASDWIKIIPSYYLVEAVHQVINFGAGLADVADELLILTLYTAAIMAAGVFTLRRHFT